VEELCAAIKRHQAAQQGIMGPDEVHGLFLDLAAQAGAELTSRQVPWRRAMRTIKMLVLRWLEFPQHHFL